MRTILIFTLFTSVFIPINIFACMPPIPSEVMIGRVSSLSGDTIDFSQYEFSFAYESQEMPDSWQWRPYDAKDTKETLPDFIHTGTLAILLTSYQDGGQPHKYSIFHITTLSCKRDRLYLGPKYGQIYGWDRQKHRCGHDAQSLLDVFPDGDEHLWIKKIQTLYPTCKTLEEHFPSDIKIIVHSDTSLGN